MAAVRYFAAAAAAAGTSAETLEASTLAELLAAMTTAHGTAFAAVLARCSLLVDGRQTQPDADLALDPDAQVDVLPPFAGG